MPTQSDISEFSHLPSSRKAAKACGSTRYFNENPCPKGHVVPRSTSGGGCSECARLYCRRYAAEHADVARQKRREYYWRDPEAARKRVSEWQRLNPAKKRENARAWDEANRDRKNSNLQRWRTVNKDRVVAINQRNYENNKEVARASNARWREKNPEKIAALTHKRRARLLDSAGIVSGDDIAKLRGRQKNCPDCGVKFCGKRPATIDHIVPLARGGRHEPSNIELRCRSCNSKKHARDPFEHAKSLGRLL